MQLLSITWKLVRRVYLQTVKVQSALRILHHQRLQLVRNSNTLKVFSKISNLLLHGNKYPHQPIEECTTDLFYTERINSTESCQRWCKNHSLQSTIISHVMQQAGLPKNQNVIANLKKNRKLIKFNHGIKWNSTTSFDININQQFLAFWTVNPYHQIFKGV